MLLTILNIIGLVVVFIFLSLIAFGLLLMIHAIVIQCQLDEFRSKGYNLNTFKSSRKMLFYIWIWNARHFTTEDTFLDRL